MSRSSYKSAVDDLGHSRHQELHDISWVIRELAIVKRHRLHASVVEMRRKRAMAEPRHNDESRGLSHLG